MAVLSKKGFSRIINGKKFGAFLKYAVVIFALVFAGLAAPVDAASPKIATIADYTEPYNDLDPSAGYSQEITILQNVYETLTRYSAQEKKPVPLLAESWSSSADGKTWIFKIRQGVKFHDGSDLDSSVVKKSIERTINMKKGASFIWDPVEKIETPDDHTVVFVLKNPAPVDIIASSGYAAYIISPKAVENDGEWFNEGKQDGGSGPYMLVRAQRREQAIVKKFDGYWRGWTDDQLDGAIFQIYSESSSRRQLIEKGDVHITYMLSASDMKALQQNPDVTVYESPSWKNIIGFWNTEKPPFDNADLRKALKYAFPYDEVIKNVADGRGAPSRGIVPAGLWGHSDDLEQSKFDMKLAAEYLKKSGVDPSTVKIEATIMTGVEVYRNSMQIYRTYLRELGIELNIREMTWDNQWSKAKYKNPPDRQDLLVMAWWPDNASPMSWFTTLVHSENDIVFNLAYIKDPELDKKIERADELSGIDRAASGKILIDIQKELIDKGYMFFMYDQNSTWVVNNRISGFYGNPSYDSTVPLYDLRMK